MRLVALVVVLGLAGCFDAGTECADGFTCPAGTRCANPATDQVHCVAVTCGNGVLDEAESCDGDAIGEGQCLDLGYDEGALRCDVNCAYDARECKRFGFSTVYAGADRIGQFCAYETPAGVVAHVQQRLDILRIAGGATEKLPAAPEAPAGPIACVPDAVAILGNRPFTYANGAWSQGPEFADSHDWTALTVDNHTKVVAMSTSTTGLDATIYEYSSSGWSVSATLSAPCDQLDVHSGYGLAVSNEDDTMSVRQSSTAAWGPAPRGAPMNVLHVWGVDDTRQFLSLPQSVVRPIGTTWVTVPFISPGRIVGRSYDDVFVLGGNSRLQSFDGMTWSTTTGGFDDAWVASTGTFYGSRGNDLVSADALWFTMLQSAEQIQITGSTLLRLDAFRGLLFINDTQNAAPNARAFAASTNMVFLVGAVSPSMARAQRITISPLNYSGDDFFMSPPLEAVVAASDTEAFAVGESGAFARFRANTWSPETIATVDLHGIARTQAGELIVVGDAGTILTSANGNPPWTPADAATTSNLRGVWTDGTNVFAVGDAGTIVRRGSDGVWTAMQSRTSHDLFAVHGTGPNDVIAVGKDAIARFDGVEWSALRPAEPNAQLSSVWATPRRIYVGSTAAGYVLRRRL